MDYGEPDRPRLRPIRMHRALTAALGLLLATSVSSCGETGSVPPSPPPKNAVTSTCSASDPGVKTARTFARADLDGDGKVETVSFTGTTGKCPLTLFVRLSDRYTAVPTQAHLSSRPLTVQLPGRRGALLMAKEFHPRGGYQVHLYGMDEHQNLGELLTDGHPVVPFVALDSESPVSVGCATKGFTVSEARPTDPPGVMFAWDVFVTAYTVQGTTVTAGAERKVRISVPDKVLKRQRPDLFRSAMFTGCGGSASMSP